MRISCQAFGAAGLLLALAAACTPEPTGPTGRHARPDPAAQALWDDYAAREADPVAALRAEAHRVGERLRTGLEAEAWAAERARIPALGQAPACALNAAALPWADWVAEDRKIYGELAAATLRGAHVALGAAALPLARDCDERTTPDPLRLAAHRILWAEDPGEAHPRARTLLFREAPRARDSIRPAYLEHVLPEIPAAEALDLLLQAAMSDAMEPRARLLAIRLLGARKEEQAVPMLESIYFTERGNFMVRREAMITLLAFSPARGKALLARRLPEEQTDPALADFLAALRREHAVSAI
jgi:hypothetical protein